MPRIEELEPVPCRTRPIIFILDASVDEMRWERQVNKANEILAAYKKRAKTSADYRVKAMIITYGKQTGFAKNTLLEEAEINNEGLDNLLFNLPPNYDSVVEKLNALRREKALEDVTYGSLPPYVYWFFSQTVPFKKAAINNESLLSKLLTKSYFEYACFWFIAIDDKYEATHDLLSIYNIIKLLKGIYPISSNTEEMIINDFALEVVNQWSMTDQLPSVCNEICFYFIVETSGGVKGQRLAALNSAFEKIIESLKRLAKDRGLHVSIGVIEYNSGCRWLTPDGAVPIEEFKWEPFINGGLADLGAALQELKRMIRYIDLCYPSPAYMPVFTFFACREATDDWKKAYDELKKDCCFAEGQHIGITMSEEPQSFLHEFTNKIWSLETTDFESFAKAVRWIPMDDVIPRYFLDYAESDLGDTHKLPPMVVGLWVDDPEGNLVRTDPPDRDLESDSSVNDDWDDDGGWM